MQVFTEQERADLLAIAEGKGEDWSSKDFCDQVKSRLERKIGNRGVLKCTSKGFGSHAMAIINYYNVPLKDGKARGGAVAENNRAMFVVDGFGKGEGEPSPRGKVKLETSVWSFSMPRWGKKRPRGATAAPAKILDKIVKVIEQVLELEPYLG